MSRPRLLDLCCGAGGCSEGYNRVGLDIVGVDIKRQPNYPFPFREGGVLAWLERFVCTGTWPDGETYDAVHASPPCPGYSTLAAMHPGRKWPKLIGAVRDLLEQTELPWIIENVEGAPLATAPTLDGRFGVVLCGSMFGLGVERGFLRRHRLFETTFPVPQPSCSHQGMAVGVYGHGGHTGKHRMLYRAEAAEAMDIDWMNRDELSDAIPPAYTEHIGAALMGALQGEEVAA